MTKLFGLDLHENTLLLSMIGGVLWLFVHNYILAPFLYSPLAYVLCDVQKPENEKQKLDLEEKLPFYFGKAIYGSITLGIWINYASTHPGWENFWEWDQYCYRLPLSHPEYKDVLPIYVWYFAYVFFIFMKDFFKSYRKDAGWSQYLFDFHHLIAIGLVYMSITYGWWRGGFLTRIIHDLRISKKPPPHTNYFSWGLRFLGAAPKNWGLFQPPGAETAPGGWGQPPGLAAGPWGLGD